MPRKNSTAWSTGNPITATRLEDFNEDIDEVFNAGTDHFKVYRITGDPALQVRIGPGTYRVGSAEGQYAGGTLTVGVSVTTYIMIDTAGTIQTSTSGWNTNYARLAVVISNATIITSITDWRNAIFGGKFTSGIITEQMSSGDHFLFLNESDDERIVSYDTITEQFLIYKKYTQIAQMGESLGSGIFALSIVPASSETNLIPTLSSNTGNPNFIASASSEYNSGYAAWLAFNNVGGTSVWYTGLTTTGQWIQMTFGSVKCLVGMTATAKDANYPAGWKIQYSIDGTTGWTDVYTGSGAISTGGSSASWSNTVSAKYWRLFFPYALTNLNSLQALNFSAAFTPPYSVTAYKSYIDTGDYTKFAGFVIGPKNVGDSVLLNANDMLIVSGFSGLTPLSKYYLSSTPGAITTVATGRLIGIAMSSSSILLNSLFYPGTSITKP